MSKGRGILVTHKPIQTQRTNEFYRLARLARTTAWQRVEEKRKNGRTEERSIVLALPRFPASPQPQEAQPWTSPLPSHPPISKPLSPA